MKLQPQIEETEAKIDEILYRADIFFAKETDELNPNVIFYATNTNNRFRFGFIGWDFNNKKVCYIAEHTEATAMDEKNCKEEGILERPDPHLFELNSCVDFIKWLRNESPKIMVTSIRKTLVD